jgi:hypothetical protein
MLVHEVQHCGIEVRRARSRWLLRRGVVPQQANKGSSAFYVTYYIIKEYRQYILR